MSGISKGAPQARRMSNVSAAGWGAKDLPYRLTIEAIQDAMQGVYSILDDMSRPLVARGVGRVEDFMLGNSLSGLISELLVQGLSRATGMKRNILVGGFPDLLPATYPGNLYQDAPDGIEIKTTIQRAKLEAHHQFVGQVLLFQYFVDIPDPNSVPVAERWPIEFYGVVFGQVQEKSWWNRVSKGNTGKKTQNTTLKAEHLRPLMKAGTLFSHPDKNRFLARMKANRVARKALAQASGAEIEPEDLAPQEDLSEDI